MQLHVHGLNQTFTDSPRVHAPARIDGPFGWGPLLTANLWYMSAVHDSRREANINTPRCFHTLWSVLCLVTSLLRGRIRNLGQQDVDDLLFSLSREHARRAADV
jgi:hypothetical protein